MRSAAGVRLVGAPTWGARPGSVLASLTLPGPFALGTVRSAPTAQVSVVRPLQYPKETEKGNLKFTSI